jgi:septal ring factor EnvC (AmiA/AmiB activator)
VKLEKVTKEAQQFERLLNDKKDYSSKLEHQGEILKKKLETVSQQMSQETQRCMEANDRLEYLKRDYETRLGDQGLRANQLLEQLD